MKSINLLTKFKQIDTFLHSIEKNFYENSISDIDAFATSWFLIFLNPKPNQLFIKNLGKWWNCQGPTAIFSPAFGIVEYKVNGGQLDWVGYGSETKSKKLPTNTVVFSCKAFNKINSFNEIINIFEGGHKLKTLQRTKSISKTAQTTMAFLQNHFLENFSIEEISRKLNISYSTMTQEFKKYYGLSPKKYLKKVKVMHALHDIKVNSLSVSDSCLNSGFNDFSRFSYYFKQTLGRLPSKYENQ